MEKVNSEFVQYAFAAEKSLSEYTAATFRIGLWESEKILYRKYLKHTDHIIDIGCGTGRATFGLYNLGYQNIIGLDISKEMLNEAIKINASIKKPIHFIQGDATNLQFEKETFHGAVFTYNGLMQIPGQDNRLNAFVEINRILKKDGIFIFTTHDMENDQEHAYYWKEEAKLWEKGLQNPKLVDFGDLLYKSYDREMFMHVPSRKEILDYIEKSGFELIEDLFRPDIFEEIETVKFFSDECRFWIVRKVATPRFA